MRGQFSLEKIITYPTWREMLLDLVSKEELDPWDIDISVVTAKYIDSIRKMKTVELRIPANLILAAAILLRYKSEILKFEEPEPEFDEPMEDYGPIEIPDIELNGRIPPKRRVTLDELINAVDKIFKEEKTRSEMKLDKPTFPSSMVVEIPKFDIDKEIEMVLTKINGMKDDEGLVLFSNLISDDDAESKIYALLPLLYLHQTSKIHLIQEEIFGDIIINVGVCE